MMIANNVHILFVGAETVASERDESQCVSFSNVGKPPKKWHTAHHPHYAGNSRM